MNAKARRPLRLSLAFCVAAVVTGHFDAKAQRPPASVATGNATDNEAPGADAATAITPIKATTPMWSTTLGFGLGGLSLDGKANRKLSGTSTELWLAGHRRFRDRRWALAVELAGFVVAEPTYRSGDRSGSLTDAVLFGAVFAVGAAFVPNPRWSFAASIGPAIGLVGSPRVFAATDWGLAVSGSVTRSFSLGRGFAVGGAFRTSIATLGGGVDEWTSLSATFHVVGQWRR